MRKAGGVPDEEPQGDNRTKTWTVFSRTRGDILGKIFGKGVEMVQETSDARAVQVTRVPSTRYPVCARHLVAVLILSHRVGGVGKQEGQ